ncbi:MAG: hypothetical protein NTX59_10315 [Elusimicrobia bacterium]|nr:hypothetical protein [Elusimicrobiota bacterium]
MSNRSKGNMHEKKVADYLKTQGYLVERSFGKPGWIPGRGIVFCARDLFGAFDIVALRQPSEVRFIQVTSGAVAVRRNKTFSVWPQAEVWEFVLRGIYRIHRLDQQPTIVDTKGEHYVEKRDTRDVG